MKPFLYLILFALYVFAAVCAILSLFFVPGYATLKVAALVGAALATPLGIESFRKIIPGAKDE